MSDTKFDNDFRRVLKEKYLSALEAYQVLAGAYFSVRAFLFDNGLSAKFFFQLPKESTNIHLVASSLCEPLDERFKEFIKNKKEKESKDD